MAHWLELTFATWRFDASRNASGRVVAPERRISSAVITCTADATSDNFLQPSVDAKWIQEYQVLQGMEFSPYFFLIGRVGAQGLNDST